MKTITAKFNSVCAETGKKIKKGESMVYDYTSKKCYHSTSNVAQSINTDSNLSDMITANEDQYFDNFCHNNNI